MLRKIRGLQGHVLADQHGGDFLPDAFDLRYALFKLVFAVRIDCHGEMMIAKGYAPGFHIIRSLRQLFAQRDRCIIRGAHLAHGALDVFQHDVVWNGGEGVGQHHINRQIQRIQHGDVRYRGIGFDGEQRPIAQRAGHFVADAYFVCVKDSAARAGLRGQRCESRTLSDRTVCAGVQCPEIA